MSVRAYKIYEIKTARSPTFNLWHNIDLIETMNISSLDENGGGLIEVLVRDIKEAIKECELDKETIEALELDISGYKDNDYIQYYCY